MKEPLILGGYILLSRKLIESEIMKKPPLYLKVWAWLLLKAQHQNYKGLNRGQLLTSIPEIREAMAYKVGYRVEKPTKKQIWGVLDWLRNPYEGTTKGTTDVTTNEPMIVTTKVTHGILVNIVKYDLYQTSQNYEGNNEGNDEGNNEGIAKELRRERQGNNINKNDKNDKNDKNEKKNIYNIVFDHWNSKNIIVHKKLTDEFKKDIDKALKESTQEEILKTINHYAEAYHDPSYEYCSYKWGIHEFLTRKEGYKRFLDDGSKWLNYLKHKKKKEGQNGSNTENNQQDYDYSKLYYQPKSGCHDDIPEDI